MKRNILAIALASAVIGGTAYADDNKAGGVAASETGRTMGEADRSVGETLDDAAIVAKVKAGLLSSSDVEGLDVNVDARNGNVTLSGTADTMAERSSAEQIAKTSEGVKSVDNRIVIKADASPATPAPRTAPAPAATPADPVPADPVIE